MMILVEIKELSDVDRLSSLTVSKILYVDNKMYPIDC